MGFLDSDNSRNCMHCRYVEDWLSSTPSPPKRSPSPLARSSSHSSSADVVPSHVLSPPQQYPNPLKRKLSECNHYKGGQSPYTSPIIRDTYYQRRNFNHSPGTDLIVGLGGPGGQISETNDLLAQTHGSTISEPSAYYSGDMELSAPSLASVSVVTSKTNLKSKLEALQFDCSPAFTFHDMPTPEKIPPKVKDLLKNLLLSAGGHGCIPFSLKSTIESDPNLETENIPSDMWGSYDSASSGPTTAELKVWDVVQDLVKHTALLSRQNAEESEYYPLVQRILGGSRQGHDIVGLVVKQVTMRKFNPHHLPQDQNLPSRSGEKSPTKRARRGDKLSASGPILDTRVDIAVEHEIPTITKDSFPHLPFSLITALRRNFGSAWGFGPYSNFSLVTCLAEVKTAVAPSRLEAEFQAAVGGSCMIAARLELIELVKACANIESEALSLGDESWSAAQQDPLLEFSFPVITLVILGDTWYIQIVYLGAMTSCMVLPPRLIGESTTHAGVFKLLSFVDSLRNWCFDVYAKEFASLLKRLGTHNGWSEPNE